MAQHSSTAQFYQSHSQISHSNGITMITNNNKKIYDFGLNIDLNRQCIRIQAKNKFTKDAYYGEYTQEQLKKMGFYQSIKGIINILLSILHLTNYLLFSLFLSLFVSSNQYLLDL